MSTSATRVESRTMVSTRSQTAQHRGSTSRGKESTFLDGGHHGGFDQCLAGLFHDLDENIPGREILHAVRTGNCHFCRCLRLLDGGRYRSVRPRYVQSDCQLGILPQRSIVIYKKWDLLKCIFSMISDQLYYCSRFLALDMPTIYRIIMEPDDLSFVLITQSSTDHHLWCARCEIVRLYCFVEKSISRPWWW